MNLNVPFLTGLIFSVLIGISPSAHADEVELAEMRQSAIEAGDPAAGESLFRKKCRACHKIGEDAKNGAGPVLNAIVGAEIASVEGFKYSKPFRAKKEEGLVWTPETIDEYLISPRAFITKTKMSFIGFKKPDDRANVIAYLATVTGEE